MALGIAFLTCFATGLVSHFAQHPLDVGFLSTPASPGWLYRITQGVHVATGIASIPLLLLKLWTVYPLLFAWPPARNVAHATERLFVGALVSLAIFQLFSGLANTTRWYPWEFNFVVTHFWTSWMLIGVLLIHIGAKLRQTRRVLRAPLAGLRRAGAAGRHAHAPRPAVDGGRRRRRGDRHHDRPDAAPREGARRAGPARPGHRAAGHPRQPDGQRRGRRRQRARRRLAAARRGRGGASAVALARRPAGAAPARGRAADHMRRGVERRRALERRAASADLLERAGAAQGAEVVVASMQTRGSYRTSELNTIVAGHEDTLLALDINGEQLHIDHGFPCRLIAPNRPGVMQTKWVTMLEVRS